MPTVVASYLAFIELILDGTEAGIPWRLVRDNKQFAIFGGGVAIFIRDGLKLNPVSVVCDISSSIDL